MAAIGALSVNACLSSRIPYFCKSCGISVGLDAAGLCFEGEVAEVRLAQGDASFVDVIHTDGENIVNWGKIDGLTDKKTI